MRRLIPCVVILGLLTGCETLPGLMTMFRHDAELHISVEIYDDVLASRDVSALFHARLQRQVLAASELHDRAVRLRNYALEAGNAIEAYDVYIDRQFTPDGLKRHAFAAALENDLRTLDLQHLEPTSAESLVMGLSSRVASGISFVGDFPDTAALRLASGAVDEWRLPTDSVSEVKGVVMQVGAEWQPDQWLPRAEAAVSERKDRYQEDHGIATARRIVFAEGRFGQRSDNVLANAIGRTVTRLESLQIALSLEAERVAAKAMRDPLPQASARQRGLAATAPQLLLLFTSQLASWVRDLERVRVSVNGALEASTAEGSGLTQREGLSNFEDTVANLTGTKARDALVGAVFITSQIFDTAFGRTIVQPIDPADPRLRGATEEERGVLEDASWRTIFDDTRARADGKSEFIVVQESPIHYRLKSLESDPTGVVSQQIAFAQKATKLIARVAGAAAAAYGIPAADLLEGALDIPPTAGADGNGSADASAITRARVEAQAAERVLALRQEEARRHTGATSRDLAAVAERMRELAKRMRAAEGSGTDLTAMRNELEELRVRAQTILAVAKSVAEQVGKAEAADHE